MKFRPSQQAEPEVNLTSLIDVILLLLVFFMVTTSFVRESELTIRLPEVNDAAESVVEPGMLDITVSSKGAYFVNGRALIDTQATTLMSAIRKVAGEPGDQKVTLTADANASHQSVVTAMDVIGRLGFSNISIATIASSGDGE